MTITIYQFTDLDEYSGQPVYPAAVRTTGVAVNNTYTKLSVTRPIIAVLIYNDSSTTGVHVRIATADSGQDAGQGDTYIGPDATGLFYLQRKRRDGDTDGIWITALADT